MYTHLLQPVVRINLYSWLPGIVLTAWLWEIKVDIVVVSSCSAMLVSTSDSFWLQHLCTDLSITHVFVAVVIAVLIQPLINPMFIQVLSQHFKVALKLFCRRIIILAANHGLFFKVVSNIGIFYRKNLPPRESESSFFDFSQAAATISTTFRRFIPFRKSVIDESLLSWRMSYSRILCQYLSISSW